MSAAERRWLEVRVRCRSAGDRAPLLADGLMALGGRAAEERGRWYVTHVDEPDDPDAFVQRARDSLTSLTGLDGIEVQVEWKAHEDWAETWKRGLVARRVTDRIVVRPSWIEVTDVGGDGIVIVLDPGMAFGTAEHGTTRGCLRLLDGVVEPGDRVLDVGAGSGILAVAAAHLGAAEVVAIEGDPLACEALEENLVRNGVTGRVRVVRGWVDEAKLRAYHPVSGVVANLETGILTPLFPGLTGAIEVGGWLIVSGVIEGEWQDVEWALVGAGCRVVDIDADGEWRSGLFRRHA